MGTQSSRTESERLAMQRKVLAEKFGLMPEPGEPAPTLTSAKAGATPTTTLGRPCPPGGQPQSGTHSIEDTSSPRTPSVIQIDQDSQETETREVVPDPDREYGLRLQGTRFCYRASVHEQARAPRELLTVTPVTVYASSFEESTARRIAVHDNWIAYAVKNHIRLLHRRQGQRALLKGHEGAVQDLAIAPQCPRALLSAAADGSIILWRLENWDAEPSSPPEQRQWQTQLSSRRSLRVALSPDARWMAFTENAQVHVLPLTTELTTDSSQRITIPSTHEVRDVVFLANASSTGWRLIIASAHGMVLIAEPESGTIVGEFSAHGGAPVERVLSVAPNVIVTAAEHCSELWYWRLVGHWTQKSTGSVHLLARCSFRELPGFSVITADSQGEFLFLANSGTKQLFILHHASSTYTPDYLVQVPLRHAVLSCCATRSIRRERDLDENSGLPQVRELVEIDLWCVHEKTIQAYHGRRDDLTPVMEPSAMETWTETSDEERPGFSERISDGEQPATLDAAMSTSPPVLLTHTHTLYETFRRIAPQLSQRSAITNATASETDATRDASSESADRSPLAVSLDTRAGSLRAPLTPTINATKVEEKELAVGSSIAMASLEGRLAQMEHRLARMETFLHQLSERMDSRSTGALESTRFMMLNMATECLVPALERASALTADSLSRALDEAIRIRLMPLYQRLEDLLERHPEWSQRGATTIESHGAASVHTAPAQPSLSPREQILRWLHQSPVPNDDRAFHLALSQSDLETLMWLCEQRSPELVCEKLSQPVLLSLVQQLSFDLRTHTERKIAYLEEAVPLIQPSDAVIAPHVEPTMRQLVEHLDEQVLRASGPLAASLRTRARLLRKVAALLVPTMSAS